MKIKEKKIHSDYRLHVRGLIRRVFTKYLKREQLCCVSKGVCSERLRIAFAFEIPPYANGHIAPRGGLIFVKVSRAN